VCLSSCGGTTGRSDSIPTGTLPLLFPVALTPPPLVLPMSNHNHATLPVGRSPSAAAWRQTVCAESRSPTTTTTEASEVESSTIDL